MGRRRGKEGDAGKGEFLQRGRGTGIQSRGVGRTGKSPEKPGGRGSGWRGFCSWSAEEEGCECRSPFTPPPTPGSPHSPSLGDTRQEPGPRRVRPPSLGMQTPPRKALGPKIAGDLPSLPSFTGSPLRSGLHSQGSNRPVPSMFLWPSSHPLSIFSGSPPGIAIVRQDLYRKTISLTQRSFDEGVLIYRGARGLWSFSSHLWL